MSSSATTAMPLVSTIIPTFNRRDLVCRAVASALAQTYVAQEVIVIDDGSTDDTGAVLADLFGHRIRYVAQPNAGVSRARNHGIALARGEYIALLDSDDEWHRNKLAKQVDFLQSCPDFGMVVTDVQRVDGQRRPIDVFRRRDVFSKDGDILIDVLRNPALVPASVLVRAAVIRQVGGFDESLRTAEDIELHLRIATRFKIGLIEEALTTAMRGHEGLSQETCSDADYVRVIERFVLAHAASIPAGARRCALFETYARNSRSAVVSGRFGRAVGYWMKGAMSVRSLRQLSILARLLVTFIQVAVVRLARCMGLARAVAPNSL